MEKKMTYPQALTNAIEVVTDVETKARLEDLLASLQKRASSKKATKTQVENEGYKDVILTVLKTVESATISEIQAKDENLAGLKNQKMSALLKQLIDADLVEKTYVKKVPHYSVK